MGDTWHGSGPAMEFSLATLKIARNGLDSPPHRLKLQMSVMLVRVLARMASQLLPDLKRNVGIGHRRIEAVSERMKR